MIHKETSTRESLNVHHLNISGTSEEWHIQTLSDCFLIYL